MKFIDITLPIHTTSIVYPGNTRFKAKKKSTLTSTISELTFGSHAGTHIDAPRHAFKRGKGIDKMVLEKAIGSCRVINLMNVKDGISVNDLKKFSIKTGERILAKTTNSKRGFKRFYSDYVHLTSEAARYLAKKNILLFGFDYLSVKERGNPDNTPHLALLKKNIIIVEGIDLSKVTAGKYWLIALPLKLKGLDGSPARVVLIQGIK